jgi:predicted small integral membrane protein
MRFTKKFLLGVILEFAGILTAFNNISDYRTRAIVLFWLGMSAGLAGLFLMFKGIKLKKNPVE